MLGNFKGIANEFLKFCHYDIDNFSKIETKQPTKSHKVYAAYCIHKRIIFSPKK